MRTLHVRLECGEGSLRRLLGLIEGRGFSVDTLSVLKNDTLHDALLCVTPRDDTRRVELLARQVNRLIGVEATLLDPQQAEQVYLATHGRGMHWA